MTKILLILWRSNNVDKKTFSTHTLTQTYINMDTYMHIYKYMDTYTCIYIYTIIL